MSAKSQPGSVLVVDDHEIIRDVLERNLESQGHRVLTAASGREALSILFRQPVDLVLLDVMMPEMSGIEVLARIKSTPAIQDTPVLMLSADSDTDRIVSCINRGAEDYLVKPFNPIVLNARVNSSLERRRLRLRDREYQQQLEQRVAERTALAEQRAAALERSEAEIRRQSHILQSILNSIGDAVVVVDADGSLLHQNPAATLILDGRLASLLSGDQGIAPVFRLTDQMTPCAPEDLPITQALNGREVDGLELFVAPADAESAGQWLSVTARPLRGGGDLIGGGVAVVRDISAAKSAELALRESEQRYALAARGANDGLWDWDLRSGQVYFSPRWKAMLGYAEDEFEATLENWFAQLHPDDREPLEARLAAHHRQLITHFEYEYRIRHRDGSYRWMLCRGLAVWDDLGRATRMAGSQTDITERKQVERQLLHDALHDGLTGLPNRTLFVDRLEHAIGRARRNMAHGFTVMFLDLDRFKIINDSLGHTLGDQMLVAIARRLETCMRPGDTVARLGGDEFTLLLEDARDEQVAREVATRVQSVLSAPLRLSDHDVFTTVSIGIVLSGEGYASAADIIRDADTAMYNAKMGGKARAVVFNPVMHAQAMSQLRLESDLRWAVEREELRLHYQPIITFETGQIAGVEALVRWEHPHRGLLYPGEFLAIAEETGLIAPISWWALRAACIQLGEWQRHIPGTEDLWISVNLSARQLTQSDVAARIRAILEETDVRPRNLKLEITEHTLIEYGEATATTFTELRTLGIQLCIDDFGTGYSSLSYLQRFPVDVLKIDGSFIHQIGEQGERSEIVHTIIELARTLGIQAVAEGTETVQQARELRRLACDFGQGWLFSKAIDASAIETLVSTDHRFIG